VVFALHAHLVFVIERRRDVLNAAMLASRYDATQKACGDFGADLREFKATITTRICWSSTWAGGWVRESLERGSVGGCGRSSPSA